MSKPTSPLPVSVLSLPDTRIAYLRQTGPYGPEIAGLWQRFMTWCRHQGMLSPRRAELLGVSLDNPQITPAHACRYDAGITITEEFAPHGEIGVRILLGGVYACAEFKGNARAVSAGWHWLCGEWLAGSGQQFDVSRPVFERYPVGWAQDATTQTFHCQLCIPLRPVTV